MGCGAAKVAEPSLKYEKENDTKFKKHLEEESRSEENTAENDDPIQSNDGTKENNQGTACPSLLNGSMAEVKTEAKEGVFSDSSSKVGGSDSDVMSPNHSGEMDLKDICTSLLQSALEQAQSQGVRSVRVGGIFIASMLPSVELSSSDLRRIRKWCDFEPPFDPIVVVEDSGSADGKAPRTHTLTRNQEILDEHCAKSAR